MPATPQQCREYRKRHPDNERRYRREYREKHPGRIRAKNIARNAIRRGDLVPGPCECGCSRPVEAHHDDYRRPLAVRWLCRKAHRRIHRG